MEEEKKIESVDEAAQLRGRILQQKVMMLMDELRAIFIPEMRLTFIARNPDMPEMRTLLTEETDIEELIAALRGMGNPTEIPRSIGNA